MSETGVGARVPRKEDDRYLRGRGHEGEDVGPRIRISAFELFGRHVLERSEDRAFLRQRFLLGDS